MNLDISRIHPSALYIINELKENNFDAYLVGGAVRDLLINKEPKDFDIVTNATNSQIAGLFDRCELIGRRFPIALVRIKNDIFEVSTFITATEDQSMGVIRKREKGEDRVPGTMQEDSSRRDFTINALYYNPHEDIIFDCEGGREDLSQKKLRFIGNAEEKIIEDPVRIIRGIRQSFQFGLVISDDLEHFFQKYAYKIDLSSKSRLIEEIGKIFGCGHSLDVFKRLIELGVFSKAFPYFFQFMHEELLNTENEINLISILKKIDELVRVYGKMRESILYGAFCIPFILRDHGELWNNHSVSMELVEKLEQKFKEIWLELTLKKWVKRKILDIYLTQGRFVFPKDKRIKSNFVFKEYFADSFRLFRFYSNLTGQHSDYCLFWEKVRKHPELMNEYLDAFSQGLDLNDEKLLVNAKKHNPKKGKWKNYHRKKRKKGKSIF